MSDAMQSGQEFNKALFANLVMMFTSSAMQQLGKLPDPATNKTEVNLQGAQVWIDMLSMLRDKTAGNLEDDEKRMLDESISSLQMNYVETAKAHPKQAAEAEERRSASGPSEKTKTETPPAEEKRAPEPESKKESGHTPRYHKSYGG